MCYGGNRTEMGWQTISARVARMFLKDLNYYIKDILNSYRKYLQRKQLLIIYFKYTYNILIFIFIYTMHIYICYRALIVFC